MKQPNILLVILDQSRKYRWFPEYVDEIIPTRAELAKQGVVFENYYATTVPCSPNRASILTGLYAHQHWILGNCNKGSSLDTGFPTISSALKQAGYSTFYFGKWHLTSPEQWPKDIDPTDALKPYGFDFWLPQAGPEVRDYVGGLHGGLHWDKPIAESAVRWLSSVAPNSAPWFSVVSFVNPHDITNFPSPGIGDYIEKMKSIGVLDDLITELPKNYEPLNQLAANKPTIQVDFARGFHRKMKAIMGSDGRDVWTSFLNFYLFLEGVVDDQVGRVMEALNSRPELKRDTVVIFTSDHGELAGSHGLKGKVATMYEEQMNLPLIFVDHTERFISRDSVGSTRDQLCSSIDIMPTLLSIAGAGERGFAIDHLPGHDLSPFLRFANLKGPEFVLATFDKSSRKMKTRKDTPPWHILCYRDQRWKYSLYSHWNTKDYPVADGEQDELYDYEVDVDRLEVDNLAAKAPEGRRLRDRLVNELLPNVIRSPHPLVSEQ